VYRAHSANQKGESHVLQQHLTSVAEMSKQFTPCCSSVAHYLGILHDLGKYHPDFQDYLREAQAGHAKRGPDHKLAGALMAEKRLGLLALVIQGHHGGLRAPSEYGAWKSDTTKMRRALEAQAIAQQEWPDLFARPAPALPPWVSSELDAELYIRMMFSALVDADYTDTAAHFNPAPVQKNPTLATLAEEFEAYHAQFGHPENEINRLRNTIYHHCRDAAEGPIGIYRLAVPTGGGKTLSAMAFALRHALIHGLERVIVAVPYMSITEQTADVYRRIFGARAVLEHHSGSESLLNDNWSRLAAENWDAPIIVTTTVQLFESLFANKPQRARKVHRIARAAVILDEAQALPGTLLDPLLDVLRHLSANYETTIVLSTATQPAFDVIPAFEDPDIQEMIPNPKRFYAALERVHYDIRGQTPWREIAQEMSGSPQALAIVNTKADAFTLLDQLEDIGIEPLHLSTQLCGIHRRAVLEEVHSRLAQHKPCHLVSTQVVEAGVDIDFPVVFRAMGPLDSIIQAAGRCNREGRLDVGRVIVFETQEQHVPPGFYKTATNVARTVLLQGGDPDDPQSARTYFKQLYATVNTDAKQIQECRKSFNYPEVAKRFRLIDDDSISAIIASYADGDEIQRIIDDLEYERANARLAFRRLQPYLVNVRRRLAARYLQDGWLSEVYDGLYLWAGDYDPVRGIVPPNKDIGDFVI